MNLSEPYAKLIFILVPSLLLLGAALATKRKPLDGVLSFIAGSDNRLSLARSQALVWTLVIFGSFAAAMAIHTRILSGSEEKAKAQADDLAKTANELKGKADSAATAAKKAEEDKTKAVKALTSAEAAVNALPATASDAIKKEAQEKVEVEKGNAKKAADEKITADKKAAEADAAASKASAEAGAAADKLGKFDWVIIPAELLMLAGIAIGSGVFSSLISAANSEDKTARLTSVGLGQSLTDEERIEAKLPATAKPLVIRGRDLGTTGKVRLGWGRMGKEFAQVLFWKGDGTLIVVDLPTSKKGAPTFSTLVADTTNGKLSHKLFWKENTQSYALGEQQQYYEFADLFRDDKNPVNFDLMKFQMFGWTVVAILIYSYLFLNDLRSNLDSLPVVPPSIVLLTGLSQAGYLTSKGISNMGSK